jgi:hypothetical protein
MTVKVRFLHSRPQHEIASLICDNLARCRSAEIVEVSGSAEVNAAWFIGDPDKPELRRSVRPFWPVLTPGMQQDRVRINEALTTQFQYFFEKPEGRKWDPILGPEVLHDDEKNVAWSLVTGLQEVEAKDKPRHDRLQARLVDVEEVSPMSGSFVLVSRSRRRLGFR